MSSALTTFLFEVANFLILASVLGWFLFKPVRNALERRQAEQSHQVEETKRKLAESEELNHQIHERYRNLDQELDQLRAETRSAAEKQADQIRAAARSAALREREAAERGMASIENEQLERLAKGVAAAVCETVTRLLNQIDGPELQRGLVSAAIRQLQEIPSESYGSVTVESATPLHDGLKAEIAAALGEFAKRAQFRTVSEIGAGVRIRTSGGVIDASASGMARFAERFLSEALLSQNSALEKLPGESHCGDVPSTPNNTTPELTPKTIAAAQQASDKTGKSNA